MDIRVELSDKDEIVIRCREHTVGTDALKAAIEELTQDHSAITLYSAGAAYIIPRHAILYFESSDGKVYAHTATSTYTAPHKLYELEELLPPTFVRVSKSAIVNLSHIFAVRRELVGNGEIAFVGCDKTVFFSRAYYKLLQYKLQEMRLHT